MGFNTTVLLCNDHSNLWPKEIRSATSLWARHELRKSRSYHRDGRFSYGQVIACEHADTDQVCIVGRNWGRYLTPATPIEREGDLDILATILRAHGYSVKAPGKARAEGPLPWGYAAKTPTPEAEHDPN